MLFKKNKIKPKHPQRRLEDQATNGETLIAPGTRIKGIISGQKSMRIAGFLEGRIHCKGIVWIDRQGKIEGTVNAHGIIIEGEINGDIESTDKTELRSGGRVIGNIRCAKIAVAEDCFFKGEVQMLKEEDRPTTFVKKRKSEELH
jgi:cytoskeletal protein CcmA (bactofilin family)